MNDRETILRNLVAQIGSALGIPANESGVQQRGAIADAAYQVLNDHMDTSAEIAIGKIVKICSRRRMGMVDEIERIACVSAGVPILFRPVKKPPAIKNPPPKKQYRLDPNKKLDSEPDRD